MDFFVIIFLLCLYYVRPHEWIGLFKILPLFKVTFILALISLFHKYRGLRFKDMVQSPQDWMMTFYFAYIVVTSPTPWDTFKLIFPLFCFYYYVAVITLNNTRRLQTFLNWWSVWVLVLALLAISCKWGYDPVGSYDLTVGKMKGRLAFNTSLFNNANALGHSVVPVIVMLYFITIWKRPVFIKILGGALLILPIYCVWLTVSKGCFLTGFATILVAVTFRRPLGVQLFIIVMALTLGVVAVQMLPRMEEISDSKSNVAIQGRVAAFRFGLEMMDKRTTGVGWANFENELFKHLHFHKAAHSSYVRVGGELGFPGLFLFVGIMYCCMRTLLFAHTETDQEERIRRILFVMLVSYVVSSWMVGWSDRGTFFLMIAAISAFHRYLYNQHTTTLSEVTENAEVYVSETAPMQPGLAPATAMVAQARMGPPAPIAAPASDIMVKPAYVQLYLEKIAGIRWRRVGWWDLSVILILTIVTRIFWHYIMRRM